MSELKAAERLIVALDPADTWNLGQEERNLLRLADLLGETGVTVKVNSLLRACGYGLVDRIHARGLSVFVDLKFFDIGQTLKTDCGFLRMVEPEIVTVACVAGVSAMRALREVLSPCTQVYGVTVLTSMTDEGSRQLYGRSVARQVLRFAGEARRAGLDGVVAAPSEIALIRKEFGNALSIITPGVRPSWFSNSRDDQNQKRVMTPAEAIRRGADRVVVGRPILLAPSRYEATLKLIKEIDEAMMG